jgi:hypothetical protein
VLRSRTKSASTSRGRWRSKHGRLAIPLEVIDFILDHQGFLITSILLFFGGLMVFFQKRMAERNAARLCARCGVRPGTVTVRDYQRTWLMCEECSSATRETYTVSLLGFSLVTVILLGLLLALGGNLVSDGRPFLLAIGGLLLLFWRGSHRR